MPPLWGEKRFMGNLNYTVEDFVLDPDFREWILHPDHESNIRWEKFLKKKPGCREHILAARRIVLYLEHKRIQPDELGDADKAEIWQKIKRGVAKNKVTVPEAWVVPISSDAVLKKESKRRVGFPFLKYAAILLFSIGLGMLWVFFGPTPEDRKVVALDWQHHETPKGTKSAVTLSDGSVVTLNSASRIRYLKNFEGTTREVYLEGEAFFEVAKDSVKPFLVHTAGLSTRALGTSFNIKAFPDEFIEISLISGLVQVHTQDGRLNEVIHPGEGINSKSGGEDWKRQKVDLDRVTAWMNKTIVFDNTPFLTAIDALEKWYGVQVRLSNFNDEDLKVSGKYKDESLENILEGLSYGIRFDYRIQGKEVDIEFKR